MRSESLSLSLRASWSCECSRDDTRRRQTDARNERDLNRKQIDLSHLQMRAQNRWHAGRPDGREGAQELGDQMDSTPPAILPSGGCWAPR